MSGEGTYRGQYLFDENKEGNEVNVPFPGDENGAYVQNKPQTESIVVLMSSNKTVNGNTKDFPINVSEFREALFFLEVTAAGGTNPTLNIDIQTKNPATDNWFPIESFTEKTATGKELKSLNNLGELLSISWVISGSNSPNFTFSVYAILKT